MSRQTVTAAVEKQGQGIEAYIKAAAPWYTQLAPTHMDASQFQGLLLNMLRKDLKLLDAAERNKHSFRAAANECCRLGLVPGVTGHFVFFEDRKRGGPPEITLIVDWKGEVEQIYRSAEVAAVVAEVVRGGQGAEKPDLFRWSPTRMKVPEHEIADDGLATAAERGPLRAVYAFARFRDGEVSTCVVLTRDEVAKHRAFAKTYKFWGPEWPLEIGTTPDMWRKTAVHYLFDRVPHSQEYTANLIRTAVLADQDAAGAVTIIPPASSRRGLGRQAVAALPPGAREGDDDEPAAGNDTLPGPGPAEGTQQGGTDGPASHTPPAERGEGKRTQSAPRPAGTASARGAQASPPQPGSPARQSGDPPVTGIGQGAAGPENSAPPGPAASRISQARIRARLADMPVGTPADEADVLSHLAGRPVALPADLTQDEADSVWAALEVVLQEARGDLEKAAGVLWDQIGAAATAAGAGG
jgi:recombination protein RecT